jgi:general secretion pathway protein D
MVLDYLSEAAGFIIILETEIRGRLDVWSNQPLDKEEAVELLNKVLNKNGYAAIRDGRTLTIVSRDDAKKRDIPVRSGNDPAQMQKSEAMITQIIPVRFINAVQVSRDLAPLFPASATIAANEGGNAVVITDTQTNIRRVAEIIRALDTSIASVSTIRVFALKFADAKALSTVVRDLFASTDTGRGNQQQQQQFRGFRPPGMGGDQGGGQQSSGSARVATPKVVAVADERSNSLVVSAPEEQMMLIADMVEQIDTNVDDVTELRVFRLEFADPQETVDLILGLFPDPTTQSGQGGRGQFRFGGFGGGQGASTATSSRLQKQTKVIAVPDLRTQSVVVSAAHELMEQIATMVKQLDGDPAKKQKVFVYSVENTDPQAVEDILRGLFEGQNTRNRSTSTTRNNQRQTGNQLNNRANNTSRNQGNRTGGFGGGTSGFGGNTGR